MIPLPITDSSEHWSRTEPHFFNIFSIDPQDGNIEVLDGLKVRLLSQDPGSGSATYLAEFPVGWQHTEDGRAATVEFFVLEGDLSVNGTSVGSGGYAFLPQGSGASELGSEAGTLSLVFWNPNLPAFPPPYTRVRVVKSWQEPVQNRIPGTFHTFYRSLRLPDFGDQGFNGGPGGYIRLNNTLAGTTSPVQHVHHECWEEGILLSGDIFIAECGVAGPGSYVSFPQEFWHAVVATQGGAVMLVHTDAPMGFPWVTREHPVGGQMVEDYLDSAPWARNREHQDWEDTPYKAWQERPEVKKWRSSPEYEAWGRDVGQGVASRFRASWHRSV